MSYRTEWWGRFGTCQAEAGSKPAPPFCPPTLYGFGPRCAASVHRRFQVPGRGLGGAGGVSRLAFTPDAAFLAASGQRGPVHLLHLADLRRQRAQTGLDW